MLRMFFLVLLIGSAPVTFAQFVAKMQIKEPIDNLCSNDVYALLPLKGQKLPVCLTSKDSIVKKLEKEVTFFKDSVNYEDKGMISIIINCKGVAVKCNMDNKTRHKELDDQIVMVFSTFTKWKPGKLNGDNVDCVSLWSFQIKDGKFSLE